MSDQEWNASLHFLFSNTIIFHQGISNDVQLTGTCSVTSGRIKVKSISCRCPEAEMQPETTFVRAVAWDL